MENCYGACFCARCGALTDECAPITQSGGETMYLCPKCYEKYKKEHDSFVNKFVGLSKFEQAGELILEGLYEMGMPKDDANFKDTPKRVARAYYEIFEGVKDTEEKAQAILATSFPSNGRDDMIIAKNVVAFSMCPHHLLPVEYRVAIAYIPSKEGRVLGLSKLARLVQLLAKRPALQEDYTQLIVSYMEKINPSGVAVMVEGRHMCMRMRGVRSVESVVSTEALSGAFRNSQTREEFLLLVKNSFEW